MLDIVLVSECQKSHDQTLGLFSCEDCAYWFQVCQLINKGIVLARSLHNRGRYCWGLAGAASAFALVGLGSLQGWLCFDRVRRPSDSDWANFCRTPGTAKP